MATSYRQVFFSFTLAALVAGCGPASDSKGSKNADAPVRQVDACTLFTAADAQAVLAEEEVVEMSSFLSDGQKQKDPSQCGYNAGSDPSKIVRIEVRRAASPVRTRPGPAPRTGAAPRRRPRPRSGRALDTRRLGGTPSSPARTASRA